jgi:hypothetical protein
VLSSGRPVHPLRYNLENSMTQIDLSQIAVSGRFIRSALIWCRFGLAALGIAAFGLAISAPAARSQGIPEDWADRHAVFSNPGSITDAVNSGSVEKWYKIVSNPRFMAQTRKRRGAVTRAIHRDSSFDSFEETRFFAERAERDRDRNKGGKGGGRGTRRDDGSLQKDWSMNLGPAGKVSAGQFPAKYSFNESTAFCDSATTPDFVVFPNGLKGASTTTANIIAYDNIYSGCAGFTTGPLIYWSYNADSGTIVTSPVLSADGTQLAFIATGTTGSGVGAALVILKWKAPATKGTNATTLNLPNTAAASYRACTAPCLTDIALSGAAPADSISSPYYDYANDVLYVGDDTGTLHKFTNIFVSGTPTEITGGGVASGWPQTIMGAGILTSPVYDVVTGNLLVGTAGGTLVRIPGGGQLVGGGSANIVVSGRLSMYAKGIGSAPIVDSQASQVYVDVACDAVDNCSSGAHASNSAIYQLTTSFASGSTGTKQTFGHNSNGVITLFAGSFDNLYFTSVNNTGHLYVCGISSTQINRPSLYQIPITNNVMGAPVEGPVLSTVGSSCSPITEILNGSTDLIFLSQQGANKITAPITCPSGTGCIMSFDVSSGAALTTSTATAARAAAVSGTSGIVIDNIVGVPAGTSEVYFTPLGNGTCVGNGTFGSGSSRGCAVQLSQAGLN